MGADKYCGHKMTEDGKEVEKRKSELEQLLYGEARKYNRQAIFHEAMGFATFYISMLFGGLAVVGGFIKSISIPPELISVCAAIGTGAALLSREAKYRIHANWNYAVRDTAEQLATRLKFEAPHPASRESVAAISEEWRRRRAELGTEMSIILGSPSSAESRRPRQKA
jgi:hypothetical protein